MAELPLGTVTFMFTDLEGSTRLWEEQPEAMRDALASHDSIMRNAIESHRGVVFSEMGDGMAAAFAAPGDALAAALDGQLGLASHTWGETGPLRARMGLHTGQGELRVDGQYVNQPLNRCARLMAIAHGGQIVISESVESLVRNALPAEVGLVAMGEHRLRDLTSAIGVFQVTHPGLPRDFPPFRSLDVLPGNLPVQMTSFVGREQELARVVTELANTRVVTLTGVGGVGKTRLALEVAAEVVPQYREGAWFTELAGVRDPEAVPDALVSMFGLQVSGGASATTTLVEFLRGKELLLVIDNCEHLLRAVASLVDEVVRGCSGVRVLVTSREGLNVAGERMLGVASLDVPPDSAAFEAIAQSDAVTLFVERAQAVKASFALDATNADAVAQVCRRLDGIALAIELAAARVAMLTPAEVAQRLDQRFRLLAGGQRTAVERHQTLRAAIDWSYELLSETEQLLLDRLSIFVGGFSLEGAEGVTADGAIESADVFDLLATLVARSLVVADTDGDETRYRLLETIRQYAQERLDVSDDGDRLRGAHAEHFARFAETAMTNAVGPDGIEWERRLARECDNLRAALTWVTDTHDLDTALRLVAVWDAPVQLWDAALASTTMWAAELVLAFPGAPEHPRYPAAVGVTAAIANMQGDQALARRRCDQAVVAEQRLGTEPSILIWNILANSAQAQGNREEAVEHARHAVEVARARDDDAWLTLALALSALSHSLAGYPAGALADAEETLALTRRVANPHILSSALSMAAFALGQSEPERALVIIRGAVALIPPGEHNQSTYVFAGDLAARSGERRQAVAYFEKAVESFRWMGFGLPVGLTLGYVGEEIADDDPEAAAVLFGVCDSMAPGYAHAPHFVEALAQANTHLDATLGAARREELYAQGMKMNDIDAVDYGNAAITRFLADEAI